MADIYQTKDILKPEALTYLMVTNDNGRLVHVQKRHILTPGKSGAWMLLSSSKEGATISRC